MISTHCVLRILRILWTRTISGDIQISTSLHICQRREAYWWLNYIHLPKWWYNKQNPDRVIVYEHIHDRFLLITSPADCRANDGAVPFTGTSLNTPTQLHMLSTQFRGPLVIANPRWCPNQVIHKMANEISRGTSKVNGHLTSREYSYCNPPWFSH